MKRASAFAALGLLLAACSGGERPGASAPATERVGAIIETGTARIELEVEIADSEDERRRGLMNRDSLPERAGMLFVHEGDTEAGFWMKDTLVPLSIAFIDADGRILEILDMAPCRADPCPLYRSGVRYRLALEVNQGAFARWGVGVGDAFRLADGL
jgi:uncharacterized membrane protein (UPF0127 family)